MYLLGIRLNKMDFSNAVTFIFVLTFLHVSNGQTVSVSGNSPAAAGTNVQIRCSLSSGTESNFVWNDVSTDPTVQIFLGETRFSGDAKYMNFNLTSYSTTESVMTIWNAAVEDDGEYQCVIPTDTSGQSQVMVIEVASTRTLTVEGYIETNVDMYRATCDAVGGKPTETITWTLDGNTLTQGDGITIDDSNPPDPNQPPLTNARSVLTFPATIANQGMTLECVVSGHTTLTELNGAESRVLNINTSPIDAGSMVTVDWTTLSSSSISVTCTAESEPSPAMRNYYIFSNDTLIHESATSDSDVTVTDPEAGTMFTCMAGNYLGNTSLSAAVTYDPTRTTIPPPTTGSTTPPPTEPQAGGPGAQTVSGLSTGAIAGIAVVGVIVVIVIIVVIVVLVIKPECISGSGGGGKHTTSSVGANNSGEKESIKPKAAPRQHSAIAHTRDNPDQAEYAMVDRKPDRGHDNSDGRGNGAGQPPNEHSMHYADLDLSEKAGHHNRPVPQNPDNVVVYSSILV